MASANLLIDLRLLLEGLAFECPFHGGNPVDCQLHEVRKWTPEERQEWIEGLSELEVARLMANHYACLGKKERG